MTSGLLEDVTRPVTLTHLGLTDADLPELARFEELDNADFALIEALTGVHPVHNTRHAFKKPNWVVKVGGLPQYVKRIAKHLQAKGQDESRAIATAINVVKKMCRNLADRLNWPGAQRKVNPGSIAQACAAMARWESMKAATHGK